MALETALIPRACLNCLQAALQSEKGLPFTKMHNTVSTTEKLSEIFYSCMEL